MDRDELIKKMLSRVEQCRRLAAALGSPIAQKALLQMADEGEADVKRLLEERAKTKT